MTQDDIAGVRAQTIMECIERIKAKPSRKAVTTLQVMLNTAALPKKVRRRNDN